MIIGHRFMEEIALTMPERLLKLRSLQQQL
jgi:hypothetical protein